MLIMIDEAIPAEPGLFARLGEVRTFDGRSLQPADLADADAVIVRSVTRVDAALLAGSRVGFVGTATSGTDHVDEAWLARQGIHFAAARGCNARPVAEYVLTAILWLARHRRFDPRTKTLGVVGVGHIGSLVARWAHALGMEVLLCDPPLQALSPRREPGVPARPTVQPPSVQWLSPSELLARADIITLHVPLTSTGPYATRAMVDSQWLGAMRPGGMLINTARGEVVVESALIEARRSERLAGLVVDVWTGEPVINGALVEACDIATPHVAGYSVEARGRAVSAIFDALAAWRAGPPLSSAIGENRAAHAVSGRIRTVEGRKPASLRARLGSEPSQAENPLPHGRGSDQSRPDHDRDQNRTGWKPVPQVGSGAPPLPVVGDRPCLMGSPEGAGAPGNLAALLDPLETACSLSNIDVRLRSAVAGGRPAERFDLLRSEASGRREFSNYRLSPVQFSPAGAEFLRDVGFGLESP